MTTWRRSRGTPRCWPARSRSTTARHANRPRRNSTAGASSSRATASSSGQERARPPKPDSSPSGGERRRAEGGSGNESTEIEGGERPCASRLVFATRGASRAARRPGFKACSGKRSGCKAGGVHRPSTRDGARKEDEMLGTVLLIIVILMLVGTLPTSPHTPDWAYFPSGGLGLVLLILLILL